MNSEKSEKVSALRARLDHPVIDGDGHLVEPGPLFDHYLRKVGGAALIESYRRELREHPTGSRGNRESGDMRGAWWGVTADAYDLATVMAPRLLYRRMDEIGIDFAILYPTLGLALPTIHDADVRRAAARALNTMNAESCRDCADRLTPAAAIPMHTPEEAIAELEYARGTTRAESRDDSARSRAPDPGSGTQRAVGVSLRLLFRLLRIGQRLRLRSGLAQVYRT